MRTFLVLAGMLLLSGGCQKAKEKVIEQQIMSYIKNTTWRIVWFKQGQSDLSFAFSSYSFFFKENKTVDALRNNVKETTGVWDGNVGNQSIYANFTAANFPLLLLNGTWVLMDGSPTFVVAGSSDNGMVRTMRMEKL